MSIKYAETNAEGDARIAVAVMAMMVQVVAYMIPLVTTIDQNQGHSDGGG